jgi:hypothetical protein
MTATNIAAMCLAILAVGCRDDYRLRVEVGQSGCAFREVTTGRETAVVPAGSAAEFERHGDTFAGTAMTFEVLCGPTPKRYTIAGTSCEEGCRIRSDSCNIDLLVGEIAKVGFSTGGFYYTTRDCEFSNGVHQLSEGPGAIAPD